MHLDLQEEWRDVDESARQTLEEISREFRSGHPIIHYVHLPSFGDYFSLSVGVVDESLATVRTTWLRGIDASAFRDPLERLKHRRPFPPTFRVEKTEYDGEVGRLLLAKVTGLRLPPPLKTPGISLDGTSHKLMIGYGSTSICLKWHEKPPAEWSDLEGIVRTLLSGLPKLG